MKRTREENKAHAVKYQGAIGTPEHEAYLANIRVRRRKYMRDYVKRKKGGKIGQIKRMIEALPKLSLIEYSILKVAIDTKIKEF